MNDDAPSAAPAQAAASTPASVSCALGLAGAAAGGAVGYFLFVWLVRQGFYGLALPGVILGVGAGLLAKRRSMPLAILCGMLAFGLSLFAEWKHFPFAKDESFGYFVLHLSDLRPLSLLMIALGSGGGFWFAWRARAQ